MYRKLKNLSSQNINTPLEKWALELNRKLSRERYKWPVNT
jgi:hypothetical protein